jgi:hypothetical protein
MAKNEIVRSDRFNNEFELLQILIDSKQIPCSNVEQAFAIARWGQRLGFSEMASFNYIINLKGKLSLTAAAIRALLIREGIIWETVVDGAFLYNDGSIYEVGHIKVNPDTGKEISVIDRITKIKFTRYIKTPMGFKEVVEFGTFQLTTANKAGLIKDGSAWANYPSNMLYARAFTNGANRIASDVLLGFYSTDTISDVVGVDESQVVRDNKGTIMSIKEDGVIDISEAE